MFDFLKGDQAQLSISVDRLNGPYYPGETVHATVSLTGQKDIKVQEARVVLMYSERYQERRKEYDRDDNRWETHEYWQTDNREVKREVLVSDGVISGGTNKTWTFDWVIPNDAPPTFDGKIVQVKWLVKTTLDRKLAKDVNAELQLPVLSRALEQVTTRRAVDPPMATSEDQVHIDLPKYEWLEGETIQGKLVVMPKSDFDVTEVRAELVRVENVPAHESNTETVSVDKAQLAGGTKFTNGAQAEFPLTLRIPAANAPTLQTPHSSASWYVKGILARRMRSDVQGQVEITVYAAVPDMQQVKSS